MPAPTLHHVAIGARSPVALADFYRAVFGLQEITRHLDEGGDVRAVWLETGPTILMFERTDHPDAPMSARRGGPFLLAFATTPDERHHVEARARELGASVEERTAYTSYWRDPEGNRVAVSHYPDERAG